MNLRVVFVCTGNRCRSPYAGRLLASLTQGQPVTVESMGTLDAPGQPSPPELIEIAQQRGLDLRAHVALPIHPGTLAGADLIIGFSFDHVSHAVVNGGAPRNVTFLLPELARLLREVDEPADPDANDIISRARASIAAAHAQRQAGSPIADEEVADPFGGRRRAYEVMANEVRRHVSYIAARLFR